MCQTDSFQWDPDFIPRAIKFSAKQLKPICLFKPDFNYYSIILCPYNYNDAHSAYTQKYWLYLLQEKLTQQKDSRCYWSLQEKGGRGLDLVVQGTLWKLPVQTYWPKWNCFKRNKKTQITPQQLAFSRILQKEAEITGMFSV